MTINRPRVRLSPRGRDRNMARVAELYLVLAVLFLIGAMNSTSIDLGDLELVQGRVNAD